MEKLTLRAPNISCDHCINSIKKAVSRLPSVQFLGGDPEAKQVTLEFDAAKVDRRAIEKAMEEEGYPVEK